VTDHSLEQAAQSADRVREELLRTLEALDERRRQATDLQLQWQANRVYLLEAALAVAAVVTGAKLLSVWRRRHLPQRRRRALERGWNHPERVARGRKPLVFRVGGALTLGFIQGLGSVLVARWVAPRLG
jgi:hypothetical protein